MLGDLPRRETRANERGPTSARPPEAGCEGAAAPATPAEQPGVMLAQSIERWTLQDVLAGLRRWRQRIGHGAPAA